jgi:hypothetical protein
MAPKRSTLRHDRPEPPRPAPAPFSIPDHALPCWIESSAEGATLCLGVRSQTTAGGHTLRIDLSNAEKAVKLLTHVLTQRLSMAHNARIAERGVPIQAMLDALSRGFSGEIKRAYIRAEDLTEQDFLI